MTRAKQNGFDAANAEPVKSLTKYAHDFIANHALFASAASRFCWIIAFASAIIFGAALGAGL